jgi:hypothetical protein
MTYCILINFIAPFLLVELSPTQPMEEIVALSFKRAKIVLAALDVLSVRCLDA